MMKITDSSSYNYSTLRDRVRSDAPQSSKLQSLCSDSVEFGIGKPHPKAAGPNYSMEHRKSIFNPYTKKVR